MDKNKSSKYEAPKRVEEVAPAKKAVPKRAVPKRAASKRTQAEKPDSY